MSTEKCGRIKKDGTECTNDVRNGTICPSCEKETLEKPKPQPKKEGRPLSRMLKFNLQIRKDTENELGHAAEMKIMHLAQMKAARWMQNAYGAVDWEEFKNERGSYSVAVYYRECLAKPDGKKTFGRGYS